MVLEIHYVKPIYPQYQGVLEACLALRYRFFEVLGSESGKIRSMEISQIKRNGQQSFLHITHYLTNIYSPIR